MAVAAEAPSPQTPPGGVMSETTDKHLEHAEHVQHAAHDPLLRKIAMSMAIIAAVLAAASMISHRGHTETLRLKTEANIDHTRANVSHTKASDMWNYYQAKNLLSRQYQVLLKMVELLPVKPGYEEKQKSTQDYLIKQIQKYEGTPGKEGDLANLKEKAEELVKEGEHSEQEADADEEKSHAVHHGVNWTDYGHLGLELALVLCSIAVLTRQRGFWYTGIGAAVVGAVLVVVGVIQVAGTGHL
jgi:hypothetical protein